MELIIGNAKEKKIKKAAMTSRLIFYESQWDCDYYKS